MTRIRALNAIGIEEFRNYLSRLKGERNAPVPIDLLQNPRMSEEIGSDAEVEQRGFGTKYDFGRYIQQQCDNRLALQTMRASVGLWSWLTLFYFDQVCPPDGQGHRRLLSLEKYLPSQSDFRRGLEKHLLFFPWKMVALHGDDAAWLLGGQLREDTKVVREMANSYRRNVSSASVKLARLLYVEPDTGKLRRGATTVSRPGNLRRLDRVLGQLDLTFDIFGMEARELLALLPEREFRHWNPSP